MEHGEVLKKQINETRQKEIEENKHYNPFQANYFGVCTDRIFPFILILMLLTIIFGGNQLIKIAYILYINVNHFTLFTTSQNCTRQNVIV